MSAFQHSRKKTLRGWVNLFRFPESPSICPVLSLRDYMALCHADAHSIFVSLMNPHKSICARTLARWIKELMSRAGVDTSVFKQHSMCSASASWHGSTKAMSAKQICKAGQWSDLTTTYGKFYHRVVLQTELQ